jgi:uncharacterized membrane protein YphA (DoxX/SURF4 family)
MLRPELAEPVTAVRTLVGLIFLTASIGKLRHWTELHGVIANYRLLPDILAGPAAYALPPLEAAIGSTLLLGLLSPWPELAAAALLVLFAAAMAANIARGRRDIDCGCFQSALKQTLSWALVARNGVLALLLGLAVWSRGDPAGVRANVDGLLVGVVLFIILQSLNILWSIVPAWPAPHRDNSAGVR